MIRSEKTVLHRDSGLFRFWDVGKHQTAGSIGGYQFERRNASAHQSYSWR